MILIPCILYNFEILPSSIFLKSIPFAVNKDLLSKNIIYNNNDSSQVSISVHNVYTNLQENSTINTIQKDLKKVGGIYAIIHNVTNKLYIGSSMDLSIRIISHIKNRSSNIYLQHAISKYGLNNFSVCILEILPVNANLPVKVLSVKLIKLEQKYLDLFNNKYNINPVAGKTRLGAKHSEATKELMSKSRKKNPVFLNKTHSKEVVEKMRLRNLGSNNPMFGKPVTDKNKESISKLFSKSVYLYDAKSFNLIAKYIRRQDISKELKVSSKTVVKYIDSGKVFRDKYIISSIELE